MSRLVAKGIWNPHPPIRKAVRNFLRARLRLWTVVSSDETWVKRRNRLWCIRSFRDYCKHSLDRTRWLWKRCVSLYGSSVRGTWRGGGSFSKGPKVYERKALGWASLFMGALLGNMEWAHLPGTLRCGWRGLWRWSLSLWELCEGNLEGGLPCWGPWSIGRKGPGDGHLFA